MAGHSISVRSTTYIMLTNYLGIGMLNLPYALRLTGWVGLPILPLAIFLFASTALMIDRSLEALPQSLPRTLPSLAHYAQGQPGRRIAMIAANIDLFGGTCAGIAMAWAQLDIVFDAFLWPGRNLPVGSLVVLVTVIVEVPFLLRKKLAELEWAAVWGVLCVGFVCVAVFFLLAIDPYHAQRPVGRSAHLHKASGDTLGSGLGGALGLYALSCSGHTVIPAIKGQMAEPKRFREAVFYTFWTMLAVYISLTCGAYYYFGDEVEDVVSASLAKAEVLQWHFLYHGITPANILALSFALHGLVVVPIFIFAQQELLVETWQHTPLTKWPSGNKVKGSEVELVPLAANCQQSDVSQCAQNQQHLTETPFWIAVSIRLGVFGAGVLLSQVGRRMVGWFMSLLGASTSLGCSVLLPIVVYLSMFGAGLSKAQRVLLGALVPATCLLAAYSTVIDVQHLMSA